MKKKKLLLLLTAMLSVSLISCDTKEITDQTANIVQVTDEHVQGVKNGTRSSYPGVKWGDALENYFSLPTWKYFKGVLEGPDEDEDGEPDYRKEDVDIVEFTGYCMYRDTKVKARIQFQLYEDDTFEPTFLAFNDVPMNQLLLNLLIYNAFENYVEEMNNVTLESKSEAEEVLNVFNDVIVDNTIISEKSEEPVTVQTTTISESVPETKANLSKQETVTFDVDDSVRASLNSDGAIKIEYTEVPMTMILPSSWTGKFVIRNGSVLSRSAYYNNNGGMLIHIIFRDKNDGREGISRYLGKAGYKHCFYYRVTDVQYNMNNQSETDEYNLLYSDIETVLESVVCTPYEDKITVNIEDMNPFLTGQISSGGATIEGYTSDYVCQGGSKSRQWICEDTWHITAKRKAVSYGVVWYECWDTDDGDYYGWIDSEYLSFYSSGYSKQSNNTSSVTNLSPYATGEISSNGLEIEGYTTDYVCNGGAQTRQWICEDTWHITARRRTYSYGIWWYECWDTDDGDYYGWIDSQFLYFY